LPFTPFFTAKASMTAAYDQIGINYARKRQPDPRIATQIRAALGNAQTIINVGAGTGSYEPTDRQVTAVEPSAEMINQRPSTAAPAIQGVAEALPFPDDSFEAAMAILTIHHWQDQAKGLTEMRRVSRGAIVLLTFDASDKSFWLLDYFPELGTLDDTKMPPITAYADWLGPVDIAPVPIPHDCTDGFLGAYWRRPEAYLDPNVRAAMSSFHMIGDLSAGLKCLEADLTSGAWDARNGHLRAQDTLDLGYRLVVHKPD
jgi:ubiquinone/menaquinone biosynthesis C-methylase UbiE